MNDNIIKLEALRERDIDLLILEEWNVNPLFAQWILNDFFNISMLFEKFAGWHSITYASLGESDLLLTCSSSNENIALLIENKIDATAQNEQASRYIKRAEKLKNKNEFNQVFIAIIAPENYLKNDMEATMYEKQISYERIADWFYSQNDLRSHYRGDILTLAIEKERRGYRPVMHEKVTNFWIAYYNKLKKEIPDSIMDEPKSIPEGSDWPMIKFEHFPKYWRIIHKLSQGYLDIEVPWDIEKAQEYINKFNCNKIIVAKPGKRTIIRIKVIQIDRHQDLYSQQDAISFAFGYLRLLRDKTKEAPIE